METATEVRYAGVVVGRAAPLRDRDGAGTFVLCAEPLPVGTPVSLKIEDAEHAARVSEVVESADANLAGMRVRFVRAGEAARPDEPPAKAPAPKAAPVAAAPVAPAAAAPVEAAPASVGVASVGAGSGPGSVEAVPVEAAPAADPSTGTAVPSPIEGDGSAAAGSGKRRRKRK